MMRNLTGRFQDIRQVASLLLKLSADVGHWLVLCLRPAPALAAEVLFLRKQLALYEERQVKSSRATNATRIVMVWLSRWFDWRVIKTPVRTPVANALCERVIGTMRRECLDFVIPLNARHLYSVLKEWVTHYNEGRPHMSLGPGIPQPRAALPLSCQTHRHQIPIDQRVVTRSVLSGLHQEYGLEKRAA